MINAAVCGTFGIDLHIQDKSESHRDQCHSVSTRLSWSTVDYLCFVLYGCDDDDDDDNDEPPEPHKGHACLTMRNDPIELCGGDK